MAIYSAAFLFEPGEYGADFHRLDALIKATARALSGFLWEVWVAHRIARETTNPALPQYRGSSLGAHPIAA